MSKDVSIPESMRAVRNLGIGDFQVQTIAVPKPGVDELLVKVERCGICAGDAKCYAGAAMFWGDSTREPYVQTPVTPGHEFIGTLIAFGPHSELKYPELRIGDQIVAEQVVPCNQCLYCKKNLRWLCAPHDLFGFHTNVNGGMAEYMIYPENSIVYKVPSMSLDASVLIEPLSCSCHGVERASIGLDDVVVVSGMGVIGLGMVASAKRKKPARLIALDCVDERLAIAKECGADILLNPMRDDVSKLIKEMTGGYGCDVYLEATGNPKSVIQGIDMIRKQGTFVEFSVFKDPVTLDWSVIGDTKELNIFGAHCSGATGYLEAMEILKNGLLPYSRIVTQTFALEDVVTGIDLVNNPSAKSVKVTLDPTL